MVTDGDAALDADYAKAMGESPGQPGSPASADGATLGPRGAARQAGLASLGTPQPYFAARSLVKYPPIPVVATSSSLAADRGSFHAFPPRAFSCSRATFTRPTFARRRRCALASVTGALESGAKV